MKINKHTRLTLDRSSITITTPAKGRKNEIYEGKLLYSCHEDIYDIVQNLVEEIAKRCALTASGHICAQCGTCCRRENILIKGADIFNIAHRLNISPEKFGKRYLRPTNTWNEWDGYIKLKRGKCPFLKKDPSGYYSCSIYDIRPESCRFFPAMGQFCRKDPGYLVEYYYEVQIDGDEVKVTLGKPDEKGSAIFEPGFEFKFRIEADKIKDLIRKLSDTISSIEGEQINLVENAIKKAESIFKKFFDNFGEECVKPGFTKRLLQLREIIEDLSDLTIKTPGAFSTLDNLWKDLRGIEAKARGEITVDPGTTSAPAYFKEEENIYNGENWNINSISIFPEIITVYFESEGDIFPQPIHMSNSDEIRDVSRALIKAITTIENEKLQHNLTEAVPVCYLCGECCSCFGIEIRPSDIRRIANQFGITEKQFKKQYLNPPQYSWNKSSGCFKKRVIEGDKDSKCVLLEKRDNGFYYCSVHEFKPQVCRQFTPRNSLCRKINNIPNWYRLPSNIIRLDLGPSKIILHTAYTHVNLSGGFEIKWKDDGALVKPVNDFVEAIVMASSK
ncbi:MAG: YkgJ family cysteine cluster protein [Candidatus Eremiobacteraeota bacterium]|nr:YkgJ family cysteine cluster protein [Candidatus Eremiobacteraeota bacterium]